jgi:hypothetical protein
MVVMRQMDGNLGLIDLKENPESDADWVKAIVQFGDNFNDLNADAEGYYKWVSVCLKMVNISVKIVVISWS